MSRTAGLGIVVLVALLAAIGFFYFRGDSEAPVPPVVPPPVTDAASAQAPPADTAVPESAPQPAPVAPVEADSVTIASTPDDTVAEADSEEKKPFPSLRFAGVVMDAASNEPIAGATVGFGSEGAVTATTDESGAYTLEVNETALQAHSGANAFRVLGKSFEQLLTKAVEAGKLDADALEFLPEDFDWSEQAFLSLNEAQQKQLNTLGQSFGDMSDFGDIVTPDTADALMGNFMELVPSWEMGDPMLVCTADGYARESKGDASWKEKADGAELRLDFFLQPGGSIRGRVTEAGSGRGLAGVRVAAGPQSQGMFADIESMVQGGGLESRSLSATTDANGHYEIVHVKAGKYDVGPNSRQYVATGKTKHAVSLAAGGLAENIDFEMEEGAVVVGTISDLDKRPVGGAVITAMPAMDNPMGMLELPAMFMGGGLTGISGEDGKFRVQGLQYDTKYRLMAQKPDADEKEIRPGPRPGANTTTEPFSVARGMSPKTVDITLLPGSAVSGTAHYADGTPAVGVNLSLMPKDFLSGSFYAESAEAKADGAFTFEAVPAGEFSLIDERFAGPFGQGESLAVKTDGVHPVSGLQYIVAQQEDEPLPAGSISGKVVKDDGSVVAGVQVMARGGSFDFVQPATTDSEGRFTISSLRGEQYDLSVRSSQGDGELAGVAVGSDVTILLHNTTSISGQVIDAAGAMVSGAKVRLLPVKTDTGLGLETLAQDVAQQFGGMLGGGGGGATTDDAGFFEIKSVDPGDYTLKAVHMSKGSGDSEQISVASGQRKDGVLIKLDPTVRFSGLVQNGAGTPVPDATVSLMASAEGMMGAMSQFLPEQMQEKTASATSGQDGRFEMPNVPPGVYGLKAKHADYAPASVPELELEPGRDVSDYRITLPSGGCLFGQVLQKGVPMPGAMVQIMGGGTMEMVNADPEGNFEKCGLPPGGYTVQAMNMGGFMGGGDLQAAIVMPRRVTLPEGGREEVFFGAAPGSVPVSGRIGGKLGTMTSVTLWKEGMPDRSTISPTDIAAQMALQEYMEATAMAGPDGSFDFEGVMPGTYTLEVNSFDMDLQDIGGMIENEMTPDLVQEVTIEEGQPLTLELELPEQ